MSGQEKILIQFRGDSEDFHQSTYDSRETADIPALEARITQQIHDALSRTAELQIRSAIDFDGPEADPMHFRIARMRRAVKATTFANGDLIPPIKKRLLQMRAFLEKFALDGISTDESGRLRFFNEDTGVDKLEAHSEFDNNNGSVDYDALLKIAFNTAEAYKIICRRSGLSVQPLKNAQPKVRHLFERLRQQFGPLAPIAQPFITPGISLDMDLSDDTAVRRWYLNLFFAAENLMRIARKQDGSKFKMYSDKNKNFYWIDIERARSVLQQLQKPRAHLLLPHAIQGPTRQVIDDRLQTLPDSLGLLPADPLLMLLATIQNPANFKQPNPPTYYMPTMRWRGNPFFLSKVNDNESGAREGLYAKDVANIDAGQFPVFAPVIFG